MRVGLTGGIASGKSFVADVLAGCGAVVIDADVLAREVVAAGTPGLAEIEHRFGAGVLRADGTLDRAALASIVFSDHQARAALNAIVHPRVRALATERERAAASDAVVVHVIPLLVETGQEHSFDDVVVVDVSEATQLDRTMRRDAVGRDEAKRRLAAQASRSTRLRAASRIIDNDGPPGRARYAAELLWGDLRCP